MTEHPTYIRSLLLHGFRAYLEPKTFDFSAKRCIAVFAPNGYGKSSLVDALEFAFSEAGTLKRLGIRTINNSAGVAALAHNLASDRNIAPSVTLDFRCGPSTASDHRHLQGASVGRFECFVWADRRARGSQAGGCRLAPTRSGGTLRRGSARHPSPPGPFP